MYISIYIYNREKGIVIIGINRGGNKFGGKDSSHFKKKCRRLLYFKVTERYLKMGIYK